MARSARTAEAPPSKRGPRARHDRRPAAPAPAAPRSSSRPAGDRLPRQHHARHGLRAAPRRPGLARRVAGLAVGRAAPRPRPRVRRRAARQGHRRGDRAARRRGPGGPHVGRRRRPGRPDRGPRPPRSLLRRRGDEGRRSPSRARPRRRARAARRGRGALARGVPAPPIGRLLDDPDGELRALRRVLRAWRERFEPIEARVARMEERDVAGRRADLEPPAPRRLRRARHGRRALGPRARARAASS